MPTVRRAGRQWLNNFIAHSLAVSVALTVATSLAIALVLLLGIAGQIEFAADRRVSDGERLFTSEIESIRRDLLAIAAWIVADPDTAVALQEGRFDNLHRLLDLAMPVDVLDSALIIAPSGDVVARRRSGSLEGLIPNVARTPGFQEALAGLTEFGVFAGNLGPPGYRVNVPIRDAAGDVHGVVRLSAFLDQRRLTALTEHTGLRLTLAFNADAPTVSAGTGPAPIVNPARFAAIVSQGRNVTPSWDGAERVSYSPVHGPTGERIGVLITALPLEAAAGDVSRGLAPVLVAVALIAVLRAIGAFMVAHRVRVPILALADAASRLQRGDYATPVPEVEDASLAPVARQLEAARLAVQAHIAAVDAEYARQAALFAVIRDPIFITDETGAITRTNQAARFLVPCLGDPVGQPITTALPFLTNQRPTVVPPERAWGPLGAGVATTPNDVWSGVLLDAEGQEQNVEVTSATLVGGNLPPGAIYVVHDVTHHVELRTFQEQLLYDVAHELRTPVTALQAVLDTVAETYAEMNVRQLDAMLERAQRTTRLLVGLMESLLCAGNIQAGQFVIEPHPEGLARLIERATRIVGNAAGDRGQEIVVSPAEIQEQVLADANYIVLMLTNLIENATKYGPAGSRIEITVSGCDDDPTAVRIGVHDDGPGIAEEQLPRLFERYYRGRQPGESHGLGLGLGIARGIVEAHGGTIGINSPPGHGTEVWFKLPRATPRDGSS